METKALKAKRPGFTDERYNETSYFVENGKFFVSIPRAEHYDMTLETFMGTGQREREREFVRELLFETCLDCCRSSEGVSLLLHLHDFHQG